MPTRRNLLAGLALAPFASLYVARALAAKKKVDPTEPVAIALKYVENAKDANPTYRKAKMGVAAKDQSCSNCRYFTADANGDGWGSCGLFEDRLVNKHGWCFGWSARKTS